MAGTGFPTVWPNFSPDGGPATSASLNSPAGAAVDSAGNLFIADQMNYRIRKVTALVTTSTAVASNLNPSLWGQTVAFTATVMPSSATGVVEFFDGAASLGTRNVSNGVASLATGLAMGIRSITSAHSGDANFEHSTSPVLIQVVRGSTAIGIVSLNNPSVFGQPVAFSGGVAPSSARGSVQFLDGPATLGTASLSGGNVSFTTSALGAGSHAVKAIYGGDANFAPSTSPVVFQTVNKAGASITVVSSSNPSGLGAPVTFRSTVSPSTATGTVQFFDGATLLGTAGSSSGTASITTSALAVGTHSIQAVYSGDVNYNGSASSVLSQVVKRKR